MNLRDALQRDCVRDLGIGGAVSVSPDDSISEVISTMRDARTGCVVVQDGGGLRGLFTERDVVSRVLAADVDVADPVASVMTSQPETLTEDAKITDVIRTMNRGGFRHMPIVNDDGKVLGVVSVKSVVQYLVEHFPEAVYNQPPDSARLPASPEGG